MQWCHSDVIARLPNGHYRDELIKFKTLQVVWKELRDDLLHEVSAQADEKEDFMRAKETVFLFA